VLVLLGLCAVPAIVRARWRGRRLRPAGSRDGRGMPPELAREKVHAAWNELVDAAVDLGWPIGPQESPRAYAARLAANLSPPPEAVPGSPVGSDGAADAALVGGSAEGDGGTQGGGTNGGGTGGGSHYPRADGRSGRASGRSRRPGGRSSRAGSRPPGRSGRDRIRGRDGSGGGQAIPGVQEAVTRLGAAEENARYAPPAILAGLDGSRLSEDVRLVARGLRARTSPVRRAWATVAPKSVLTALGSRARSGARSVRGDARLRMAGLARTAAVRGRRGLPNDDASAPRDVR
ncbi:MAG: hypothetical protein ACQSGP_15625, partial [Frankia sp.]